jgi:hypothetical protein
MRTFTTGFILLAAAAFVGCASNPHKAKKIETEVENPSSMGAETIGIKDGNMVIQKKVEMNEELRRLQNEVYSLEDRVYGNRKYGSQGLYGTLKTCRLKQTSKEMGGDGKLMWTEPMDRVTDKEDTWDVGIDEKDKIVGVSEEFLKDRIDRFQKYKKLLQQREDEYEDKLAICDAAVKAKEFDAKKKEATAPAPAEEESAQ